MKLLRFTALIATLLILNACARAPIHEQQPTAEPTVEPVPPQEAKPTSPNNIKLGDSTNPPVEDASASVQDVSQSQASYIDKKYADKKDDTAEVTSNEEASTVSAAATTTPVVMKKPSVSSDKALTYLKHGNIRFVKGNFRKDGQSKKDVKRLEKSQKPFAAIFTTSDSRVSPEIIFDEKLGEVFVVRNFGLSVDNSAINSLEYAVRYLGVGLIVVLDRNYNGASDATHAKEVTDKIFQLSSLLQNYNTAGNLKIIPAVYHLESGRVDFSE